MTLKPIFTAAAVAAMLVFSHSLYAQSGIAPYDVERVGQSGWQFLKINGDARQAAMAGAYTAISSGDANAIFGNPASLADIKGIDVQANVLSWVADIGHQSIAVAASLGDFGVVGASVATLGYGDIPETINAPAEGSGTSPFVTGNTFTARDIVAGVSYARNISENLCIGGNIRWMRQTIAELSMDNWSVDFGALYHTPVKGLRVAVTARNFGPDSRLGGWSEEYQTESDKVRMPLDFRAGVAMDLLNNDTNPHALMVIVEGDHPNDGREKFHVGANYGFDNTFFLRAGYRFNYDVQSFTFGVGVSYPFGTYRGSVNYAYLDFGELSKVHMFTLGFAL